MDDLPLEVVEKILEKLKLGETDLDDDRQTMLTVRLLNKRWKAGMENVLEQKCLASWTKWRVMRYNNLLPQMFKWLRMIGNDHVVIPEAMASAQPYGNPFISRSMYTDDSRDHDEEGWLIFSALTFFTKWGHGENITSFKTHNSLPPNQMYEVLKFFPNLKAFGTPIDIEKGEETFMKSQALPPLPKLIILELWCPKMENKYRDYFRWFLAAYGLQVVHLKLAAENLVALRDTKKKSKNDVDVDNSSSCGKVCPKMFQNLRRLKVYMPGGTFFKKTESYILLTHLSIEHYEKPMSLKGLKVITYFIDKFSKTLIKLHLDVELGEMDLQKGDNPERSVVLFPRLFELAYTLPLTGQESTILNTWFLEKFPEVKHLQLLRHDVFLREIVIGMGFNPELSKEECIGGYFQKDGNWKAASKLGKISLRTCQANGDEELLELRRPR